MSLCDRPHGGPVAIVCRTEIRQRANGHDLDPLQHQSLPAIRPSAIVMRNGILTRTGTPTRNGILTRTSTLTRIALRHETSRIK